jgi:hypothetical protein
VRGRRVDRFVQQVFPIAGELALGEHRRAQRPRAPAVPGNDDVLADAAGGGGPARERPHGELAERLHQAEARRLVVAERKRRHHHALVRGEPDRARLGDEVADGEDESVVPDHHAVADALRAEDLGGEGVLWDLGAKLHHRVEGTVEIEAPVLRPRAHFGRELPVGGLCHAGF